MSNAYFLALRDQGASLWVEVETHRLYQASRLKTKIRDEKWLRIGAGISGAAAGIGGAQVLETQIPLLSAIGGWLFVLIGLVPGVCAVLSPSGEIKKATEQAEQLAALKMEIFDHVERMRVAPTVSVADVQFIDRKRQDFVASLIGEERDVSAFHASARTELEKMNFHRLDYIGLTDPDETDVSQEASDAIVPFPVGV